MITTTTKQTPQTPPTTPPLPSHNTTPPIIPPLDLASLPSSPSSSILSPPLSPLSPTSPINQKTPPPPPITQQLTQTLQSHPPLPALHHAAYTALGPFRFQRNLARLLSHYARDLRASAVTAGQRRTAREVARSAQGIASGVAESLGGRDGEATGTTVGGFSPRGKRAMVLATLLRRGDDVACGEDIPSQEWDDAGREDGGDGDIDTSHLLSSPAFPSLCEAYLAWLNTTAPSRPVPTTTTPAASPETRRARLAQALADTTTDADRIPSASEYDTHGIWRGPGSRPSTPTPRSEQHQHPRSQRRVLPRQRQHQHWWKPQWTVALVATLIAELLSLAACWAIATRTGVPLGRVVSVAGEWLGAGLAGVVVVHVARHHDRFLVTEEGEGEGEGGGDAGVCAE